MNDVEKILVMGDTDFFSHYLRDLSFKESYCSIILDNVFASAKGNVRYLQQYLCFELVRRYVIFPLCLQGDQINNLAYPASSVHLARYGADHRN
jgi:hypothetical protein